MSDPTISVIVVSRDRPAALARCVLALSQLYYQSYEIIVVADADGLAAVVQWDRQIKRVPFEDANISQARNLGLDQAAGEIVAYIDDDAVPEPTWLCYLSDAFERPAVTGAGGYVRGRNGISYQWMARGVGLDGVDHPIDVPFDQLSVPTLPSGLAVKTQGTNMAFRAHDLRALGGFDEAYHYYLEDADLNLRMAQAGGATAVVPKAQVHHDYDESPRRRPDRVPRNLRQIGASEAVFLRRHGTSQDAAARFAAVRLRHRKSLLRHMVAGRIQPGDVRRLLRTLQGGWQAGLARSLPVLVPRPDSSNPFLRFGPLTAKTPSHSWGWRPLRNRNVQESAQVVNGGNRHTLYLLSVWPLRHWLRFDPLGFWIQSGGLIGRAKRTKTGLIAGTFRKRYEIEVQRVAEFREPRS